MASVAPSCKIVAAPEVVFGVYDSTGPNAALPIGVGSYISVVCTRGSSGIQINLNEGANNVPGSPAHRPGRRMKSGNQYLNYQVHWAPSRAGGVVHTNTRYGLPNFVSSDLVDWPPPAPCPKTMTSLMTSSQA